MIKKSCKKNMVITRGPKQAEHLAQTGVAQVDGAGPAEAVTDQPRHLDRQVQQRAQDHAIYQAVDAKTESRQRKRTELETCFRRQNRHAKDLPEVIKSGRHSGQQEVLVGLQAGHHQTADRKDQDCQQVQAHQPDRQRLLFGRESGRDHIMHQRAGKSHDQRGNGSCYQESQVQRARKQIPGCRVAALLHEF